MTKKLHFKEFLNEKAHFDENNLIIAGEHVMQRWETPWMKMLSDVVCEKKGRILEIGFGLGISAGFIQENAPSEHIIIEPHQDVIDYAEKMFPDNLKKNMKIIKGMWHEIMPTLEDESFDGILFDPHSFSLLEIKIVETYFYDMALRLLKKGGILTMCSGFDENSIFSLVDYCKSKGFSEVTYKICEVNPSADCPYWFKKTALVPIIVK